MWGERTLWTLNKGICGGSGAPAATLLPTNGGELGCRLWASRPEDSPALLLQEGCPGPSFLWLRKGILPSVNHPTGPLQRVFSGQCACVPDEDKLGMGVLGPRFKEPGDSLQEARAGRRWDISLQWSFGSLHGHLCMARASCLRQPLPGPALQCFGWACDLFLRRAKDTTV